MAKFYKHLKFAGVPIVPRVEGEVSEIHVGLKLGSNLAATPYPSGDGAGFIGL